MDDPLPREDLSRQALDILVRPAGICFSEVEQEVCRREAKRRKVDEMSDTLVVLLAAEALIWVILLMVVAEKNRKNH